MSIITYSNSQATLTLNGYTFQHLMEGEALNLAPVNAKTSRTNSMGGGVSAQGRVDGGVHTLTLMVQAHSPDDKFMNDAKNAGVTIFDGSMKRAYSENGSTKKSTTSLASGTITTQPTKVNNNQDADNSRTYVIEFRNAIELF